MKTQLLSVLALAGVLALGGCHKPTPPAKAADQGARAVTVVRLQARPITGAMAASGTLVPREEAAVTPEVSGYRVARVLVDEGAYVRRGQTLVQLDPALIQAQLAQQSAMAAQAEVQAQQAEEQARRVAGLDNQGVLSQEQIEQRRFAARAARAAANAQAAGQRDLRARAAKLAVTAPVSGLVLERTVRPGDLSAGGAAPWFRIAREGQIELAAQMAEDELARIRPGQHATVTLPSGQVAEGVVRLVSPQIDPQTKLGEVRILLPVRSDIRAGGFGRAVFAEVGSLGLAVPETAIRYDAAGASVMVVNADNRVRRVPVRTGQRGGGLVQILQGPPPGSRVVLNAGSFLLDGDLVRPTEAPGSTPAAAPAAADKAKAAR
jgi:HlyD family secretion protein